MKEFALGGVRAVVIERRGRKVVRLSGDINVYQMRRGMDLSLYEAKGLSQWLIDAVERDAPDGGTVR